MELRRVGLFWILILYGFISHIVLAERRIKDLTNNRPDDIHSIVKRSDKTQATYIATFASTVAIEGVGLAVGASIPFAGPLATLLLGSMINLLWKEDTYESYRAQFIEEIRKEMNYQSTKRMRMKLDDYKKQLDGIFQLIEVPSGLLKNWYKSVIKDGLNIVKQNKQLKAMKRKLSTSKYDFELFKDKIFAITADIRNDRDNFFIPSDPIDSLSYYREYASLELILLTVELLIHTEEPASRRSQQYTKNAIKQAAKKHFRFVYWAAHKSARIIETKTRIWRKYNPIVSSILSQFPLDEWKSLTDVQKLEDSKYLRNRDPVSFKMVSIYYRTIDHGLTMSVRRELKDSEYYEWMSCWGSGGSTCTTRPCGGEDNPFDSGKKYKHYYRCKGEVFLIHADGRHMRDYVRVCDKVALQYDYTKDGKGYWVTYYENWWHGMKYITALCAKKSFFESKFEGRCSNQVFKLEVEGRKCGDYVQDRDVLKFEQYHGYIASNGGGNLYKFWGFNRWRVYRHDSFLKEP